MYTTGLNADWEGTTEFDLAMHPSTHIDEACQICGAPDSRYVNREIPPRGMLKTLVPHYGTNSHRGRSVSPCELFQFPYRIVSCCMRTGAGGRSPFWHGTRVLASDSQRQFHWGFRCCNTLSKFAMESLAPECGRRPRRSKKSHGGNLFKASINSCAAPSQCR